MSDPSNSRKPKRCSCATEDSSSGTAGAGAPCSMVAQPALRDRDVERVAGQPAAAGARLHPRRALAERRVDDAGHPGRRGLEATVAGGRAASTCSGASKQTGIPTTFRPTDRGWRVPYERDVNGQVVDEVIDWGAVESRLLRQDRVVATLMVLAAESVKADRRSPDYWEVERRWIAGQTDQIVRESMDRVRRALPPEAVAGPRR